MYMYVYDVCTEVDGNIHIHINLYNMRCMSMTMQSLISR